MSETKNSDLVKSRIGEMHGSFKIVKVEDRQGKFNITLACHCGVEVTNSYFKKGKNPRNSDCCTNCQVKKRFKERKTKIIGKKIGVFKVTDLVRVGGKKSNYVILSCKNGHEKKAQFGQKLIACQLCTDNAMIGKRKGKLVFYKYTSKPKNRRQRNAIFKCDCGGQIEACATMVLSKKRDGYTSCGCDWKSSKNINAFGKKYKSITELAIDNSISKFTAISWAKKGSEFIENKLKEYNPRFIDLKFKYRTSEIRGHTKAIMNIFRKSSKGLFYSGEKVSNELKYIDTLTDIMGGEHEMKYFGMPCDGAEIKMLQDYMGVIENGSMAIEYKMSIYQALKCAFGRLGLNIPIHKGDVNEYIKEDLDIDYQYMHLDYISPLTNSAFESTKKALNYSPAVLVTVQNNLNINGNRNPRISQNTNVYKNYNDGEFPKIEGANQLWSETYIGKKTLMTSYCLTKI